MSQTARTLLDAEKLHYATPTGQTLATNVSFRVNEGEMLLVTGPNGVGKSSLLNLILDSTGIFSGHLRCAVARNKISLIPQLQNIEFHLPCTLEDVLSISVSGKIEAGKIEAMGLLDRHQLPLPWNTASGGERQRTLFTRAFLGEPQLLLLDEPLNHLDAGSRQQLLLALKKFLTPSETPRAVVMVSHATPDELNKWGVPVTQIDLSAFRENRGVR